MFEPLNRREMLRRVSAGVPLLGLNALLADEARAESTARLDGDPLAPRRGHHEPRAKRAIFLFMGGGPSHLELFDPKPELANHKRIPIKLPAITRDASPNCQASPYKFSRHGRSGQWMSELLPHLSQHADDLCIVKSCYCDNIEHSSALRQMFTGETVFSRPSMGSWLLYGLGTENCNLPGFVFIDEQGNLPGGVAFSSSFLPVSFQGTFVKDLKKPVANLDFRVPEGVQAEKISAIRRFNEEHRAGREDDTRLSARIAAYELAFRMQTQAPAAFDLSTETKQTQDLYGIGDKVTDDYGRKCLLARRLVERGVRFVVANINNKWDDHGDLRNHEKNAASCDKPIAGLLKDLKLRGLLDDTLVIWGGEFGRTPTSQGKGRDHHPYGFTMWFAGGGVKPGIEYGATDEFGYFAVENKVHVHDVHATILHLLGIDHERLTYRYSGRDYRLTDVAGRVVHEIIA